MDTKKFTIIVASLTVVVCIITVVFNFASMPSYSDSSVSAVPIYNNTAGENKSLEDEDSLQSNESSEKTSENKSNSKTLSSSKNTSSKSTSSVTSKKSKTSKTSSEKATEQNPVNINTADLSKLETIPYVGETHAQAIIDYRAAHGNFENVDDLDNVKGFGAKTIEKIRKFITVG